MNLNIYEWDKTYREGKRHIRDYKGHTLLPSWIKNAAARATTDQVVETRIETVPDRYGTPESIRIILFTTTIENGNEYKKIFDIFEGDCSPEAIYKFIVKFQGK